MDLKDIWQPPEDWTDIPDWDLPTSAHWEAVRVSERHRMECFFYDGLLEVPIERLDQAVAEYRASMRRLDLGLQMAEAKWAALSEVQRGVLAFEHAGLKGKANKATLRALVRRELMDDTGLTEKGRFVLLEGRP